MVYQVKETERATTGSLEVLKDALVQTLAELARNDFDLEPIIKDARIFCEDTNFRLNPWAELDRFGSSRADEIIKKYRGNTDWDPFCLVVGIYSLAGKSKEENA